MKKIFLFLIFFIFSISAYPLESKLELSKGQEHKQKLVSHQDDLLDFLLQTPFEMRQYIFPMLNEKKSVPKKIKTHPEIIIWKGKRPTKIAKKFQNDPELLEYLPAQFYYYLAPEMWPDEMSKNQSLEANPNQVFLNFIKNQPSETFAPDELIHLKKGLNILQENLTEKQKKTLSKTDTPIYLEELFNIFDPKLDIQLKEEGLVSLKEFTKKIDQIAFIYRQYKKGKIPNNKTEEAEFVREYFSLIPTLFNKTPFENLLNKAAYSD